MRCSLLLSMFVVGACVAGQAVAGPVSTGTVNLSFAGITSDSSCDGAQERENFTGTVTDAAESISNAALSFSICDIPASYAGGTFLLTVDADDTVSGTVTGTDLGDTITDGIDTATVEGTFTVTAGTGSFQDAVGYSDVYTAFTQENLGTGQGTDSFIVGTPEPATIAFTGFGVFLLGYTRRRQLFSKA
jgi:hypothetical protein